MVPVNSPLSEASLARLTKYLGSEDFEKLDLLAAISAKRPGFENYWEKEHLRLPHIESAVTAIEGLAKNPGSRNLLNKVQNARRNISGVMLYHSDTISLSN